jgi:peptidoglycan hydrolase-like protein with peptidoglycan-binding domain
MTKAEAEKVQDELTRCYGSRIQTTLDSDYTVDFHRVSVHFWGGDAAFLQTLADYASFLREHPVTDGARAGQGEG